MFELLKKLSPFLPLLPLFLLLLPSLLHSLLPSLLPPSPYLLSLKQALHRLNLLLNVQYKILIKLKRDYFEGLAIITFDLTQVKSVLLDLKAEKVYWININNNIIGYKDKKITSLMTFNSSILLPSSLLIPRSNQIAIYYKSHYNEGLSLKIIKERHFVRSSFYPRKCHMVFPCFDQPNLAVQMELTLISAKNMNVFSNEIFLTKCTNNQRFLPSYYKPIFESGPEIDLFKADLLDEYYIWVFNKTKPMPCHHYKIEAGEWRARKDEEAGGREEEKKEEARRLKKEERGKWGEKKEEGEKEGELKQEERGRRDENRDERDGEKGEGLKKEEIGRRGEDRDEGRWKRKEDSDEGRSRRRDGEGGRRKRKEGGRRRREDFRFYDDGDQCVNMNLVSEGIREALNLIALGVESKIDVLVEKNNNKKTQKRLVRERMGEVLFPTWWEDFALIDGLAEWAIAKVGAEEEIEGEEDEEEGKHKGSEMVEENRMDEQGKKEEEEEQGKKEKELEEEVGKEKEEQFKQRKRDEMTMKEKEDGERRRKGRRVGKALIELERRMGNDEFLRRIRKWIKNNEEKFVDWKGFIQEMKDGYGDIDKWYEKYILNSKLEHGEEGAGLEGKEKERLRIVEREKKKRKEEGELEVRNQKEREAKDEMERERKVREIKNEEGEGEENLGEEEGGELEGGEEVGDEETKEMEIELVDPSETIREDIEREDGGE